MCTGEVFCMVLCMGWGGGRAACSCAACASRRPAPGTLPAACWPAASACLCAAARLPPSRPPPTAPAPAPAPALNLPPRLPAPQRGRAGGGGAGAHAVCGGRRPPGGGARRRALHPGRCGWASPGARRRLAAAGKGAVRGRLAHRRASVDDPCVPAHLTKPARRPTPHWPARRPPAPAPQGSSTAPRTSGPARRGGSTGAWALPPAGWRGMRLGCRAKRPRCYHPPTVASIPLDCRYA